MILMGALVLANMGVMWCRWMVARQMFATSHNLIRRLSQLSDCDMHNHVSN